MLNWLRSLINQTHVVAHYFRFATSRHSSTTKLFTFHFSLIAFRCETTFANDCPLRSVQKMKSASDPKAAGQLNEKCSKKSDKIKSEIESGSSPLNLWSHIRLGERPLGLSIWPPSPVEHSERQQTLYYLRSTISTIAPHSLFLT